MQAYGEYIADHKVGNLTHLMAEVVGEFARAGLVNVLGGCCGTTPAHIEAIARAVAGVTPRQLPAMEAAA